VVHSHQSLLLLVLSAASIAFLTNDCFFEENRRGSPYCDFIKNKMQYKKQKKAIGGANTKVTTDWMTSMMKY
jgi:hypothetical protein